MRTPEHQVGCRSLVVPLCLPHKMAASKLQDPGSVKSKQAPNGAEGGAAWVKNGRAWGLGGSAL